LVKDRMGNLALSFLKAAQGRKIFFTTKSRFYEERVKLNKGLGS
jgi:hypothetical protein